MASIARLAMARPYVVVTLEAARRVDADPSATRRLTHSNTEGPMIHPTETGKTGVDTLCSATSFDHQQADLDRAAGPKLQVVSA